MRSPYEFNILSKAGHLASKGYASYSDYMNEVNANGVTRYVRAGIEFKRIKESRG